MRGVVTVRFGSSRLCELIDSGLPLSHDVARPERERKRASERDRGPDVLVRQEFEVGRAKREHVEHEAPEDERHEHERDPDDKVVVVARADAQDGVVVDAEALPAEEVDPVAGDEEEQEEPLGPRPEPCPDPDD